MHMAGADLPKMDQRGHWVVDARQLGIFQLPHDTLCVLLCLQCSRNAVHAVIQKGTPVLHSAQESQCFTMRVVDAVDPVLSY